MAASIGTERDGHDERRSVRDFVNVPVVVLGDGSGAARTSQLLGDGPALIQALAA